MSRYIITLKPVDKFFFGGDMTFSVGNSPRDKYNREYSSYIIESALFPQQTSLLGMMRFLLLRNDTDCFDGVRITDTAKATELIGEGGFGQGRRYGRIKSLGHCFIRDSKENKDYHFAPYDSDYAVHATEDTCLVNGRKVSLHKMEGFSSKAWYKKYLECGSEKKEVSSFFVEDRRIGINRDIKTGKTEDAALFKQVGYRFSDSRYVFAFYAETDVDILQYDGQVVSVGADNSQFVIGIKNSQEDGNDGCRALKVDLLSPARLLSKDMDKVAFCMTEVMPFRYLRSTVHTKSYNVLNRELSRSERIEMYAPGSVFYFSSEADAEAFRNALNSYEDFRRIGFNEYK